MGPWSFARSVYALDTIDTRFTSSAFTPHKSVAVTRGDPAGSRSKKDDSTRRPPVGTDSNLVEPSKWNTPEFYFYYFIFITVIPYMFWIAYDVSRREYNYNTCYCTV